jgi:hypothetical protein
MNTKERIGDCHKCPATGVPIPYGYSTRNNRHCTACNHARIRNRNALKARNGLRKSYRKGGERKSLQKPIKRKIPARGKRGPKFKTTQAHRDNLAMDKAVNAQIWEERHHGCLECEKQIKTCTKRNFSHVHSKGARPDLRHEKKNIAIHCYSCHDTWEFGDRNTMPITLNLFIRLGVEFPDNRFGRGK